MVDYLLRSLLNMRVGRTEESGLTHQAALKQGLDLRIGEQLLEPPLVVQVLVV